MTDNRPLWRRLYEDGYEQSDPFFEDAVTSQVQALAGTTTSLQEALRAAGEAFLGAKIDEENFQSEKAENAALERVAKSANALHEALCDLYAYGKTTQKLIRAIKAYASVEEGNSTHRLSKMLVPGPRPLKPLQNLTIDLAVSAETTVNRKPKQPGDTEYTEVELAAQEGAWRAKSALHRLPRDHAIRTFLRKFRQGWEAASPHPFTEGMYYREARSTASYALDAAETALKALDPSITRSRIVSTMRALRTEEAKEENLS